MAVVYRHIRLDKNEPFYIGIGASEKRAITHRNRNKYWKNIISKTDYRIEILFDDLTWEEAIEKEKEFIKLYGRIDKGTGCLVNMTDGGDGVLGLKPTDETRKKWIEQRTGLKPTDETRKKMSQSQKGKKRNEEHRLKTSIARKLNNGMSGKKPWNYGKSKYDEKLYLLISEDLNNKVKKMDIAKKYNIPIGTFNVIIKKIKENNGKCNTNI